ncbi:MAG: D-alanine--D-alanine ligase [Ruminococcaceae bacterium]|nr:D-alanine--D-alanine ligase [Oscillospiraceae bacterium]
MNKNIAVIFGGTSSEHEVSLQSAESVLNNFPSRYNAIPIWISKEGEWFYFYGNMNEFHDIFIGNADKINLVRAALSPDRKTKCLISDKLKIQIDAAFPVMHGMGGEDGTLQGLLELAGIPICGCGVLPSAVCMDKNRAHKLAESAGVSVPKAVTYTDLGEIMPREIEMELGLPVFVKPLRGGSSCGISRVSDIGELLNAAEKAFKFDNEIIIEQEIRGVEVGCAIIGTEELIIGEVDEIQLADGFFDYTEKYTPETSRILCPAPVSKALSDRIKHTAEKIYRALGCSGFSRVDMFLSDKGEIIFNEVNTIPGFTEHSRFPSMMRAAGYSFAQVIEMLTEKAAERT